MSAIVPLSLAARLTRRLINYQSIINYAIRVLETGSEAVLEAAHDDLEYMIEDGAINAEDHEKLRDLLFAIEKIPYNFDVKLDPTAADDLANTVDEIEAETISSNA